MKYTTLMAIIFLTVLNGCATNTRYEEPAEHLTITIEKDMCEYWKMSCPHTYEPTHIPNMVEVNTCEHWLTMCPRNVTE